MLRSLFCIGPGQRFAAAGPPCQRDLFKSSPCLALKEIHDLMLTNSRRGCKAVELEDLKGLSVKWRNAMFFMVFKVKFTSKGLTFRT